MPGSFFGPLLCCLLADPSAGLDVVIDETYPHVGEYLPIADPAMQRVMADGLALPLSAGYQLRPLPMQDGEARYEMLNFMGGLPGQGWIGAAPNAAATWVGDEPFVARKDYSPDELDAFLARMMKVIRISPTMHAEPPDGAVVLFDATTPESAEESLANWDDGAELLDGYLKAGTETRMTHGSGRLHLEYRIPLQIEKLGTWRGNSGVYFQNRYEIQVLDSFGDVIRDNGSGSIYRVHTPSQNLSLPPGQWQTLDVGFTAASYDGDGPDATKTAPAKLTVTYNGVPLFDEAEVPGTTGGAKLDESPAEGALYLQDHGDPVVYRNVWFVPSD